MSWCQRSESLLVVVLLLIMGVWSSLIPFRVSEEIFWRNYFYRVSLAKQSVQLSSMASGKENDVTNLTECGCGLYS